jgi:hypothetical protein
MAPPKKELNEEVIHELASIHCTMKEIASIMKCSVDTLERRYADIIKKGQDEGRSSLRRAQYKSAMGGNATMLVWLGKQLLGQKDSTTESVPQETVKNFTCIMSQLADFQKLRHNPQQEKQTTEGDGNEL